MRIYIGILVLSLVAFGCTKKKKETAEFLQKGNIKLVKPRIEVSNTIIDSFVTLTSKTNMDNSTIHYQKNSKSVLQSSTKITDTIFAKKADTYNFRAFHPDWQSSDLTTIKLYKKGIAPSKITWKTSANKKYKGQGETTLTNNKKASLQFRDLEWIGFDSIAKATVSFPEKTYIKSLTIGYLVDTKSWIFPPESIMIVIDKKPFLTKTFHTLTSKDILKLDDIKIPIKKECNTITIQVNNLQKLPNWHAGKGLKAWLFMDEWIFN
ncbi:hypothetical protein [Kordia sp.]|uniref:hypothetical protein n=1 Tax=Kordia sp. TaxID=1965332 RepID=UPI003B591D09